MKKALCLILSVVITLSAFTILAFADNSPVISMEADKTSIQKNKVVTVTVKVSKNAKLCAATIDFHYDSDFFNLESAEAGDSFGMGIINDDAGKGKIRYAMATDDIVTS